MSTLDPNKSLTILSVEDEPDTMRGALDALRAAGHHVDEVSDYKLARTYLMEHPVDFVLCDSLGTQAIIELKNGDLGALNEDVPFAFLTASTADVERSNVARLPGFLGVELKAGDVARALKIWTRSLVQQEAIDNAERPKKIFLSHTGRDKGLAVTIAGLLSSQGLNVWMDEQYLLAGERWRDAIDAAISNSDTFILLIGASQTDWSRFELMEIVKRTWEDKSLSVLPIAIGDVELPGFLRDTNVLRVDPETGEGIDAVLRALSLVSPISTSHAGRARLNQRWAELEQLAASTLPDAESE